MTDSKHLIFKRTIGVASLKKYQIEIYQVRAEYDLIVDVIEISSDKSSAAIRYRYEQLYPENAIKVIEIENQR